MDESILWFNELRLKDTPTVGGKNASLGEMISQLEKTGVKVPNGFATTVSVFHEFLDINDLSEIIAKTLDPLDVNDVKQLTYAGQFLRDTCLKSHLPPELETIIRSQYSELERINGKNCPVAVRSSATAEDLPEASFAGQQESYLNVRGASAILRSVKRVFASIFNDRAIAYRIHSGFSHQDVALSVGIQLMVRSDLASSGVMFTLDTETGFNEVVFITSSYGLGESVVQGSVNPDEFYVFKRNVEQGVPSVLRRTLGTKQTKIILYDGEGESFTQTVPVAPSEQKRLSLSDPELEQLARHALAIENHYSCPMDIEWAKDGTSGDLFILQARPETVKSRDKTHVLERYQISGTSTVLCEGRSIGSKIGSGTAKVIKSANEMEKIDHGDVLVTDMTDPDWEPVMARASAIVTNRGGRTCHAAIIARELGVPAVVGTGNATQQIKDKQEITVSCAQGETGFVFEDCVPFTIKRIDLGEMPDLPVKLAMNIANPDRAFDFCALPNDGVGLARLEFIINHMVGIHPKALINFENLPDNLRDAIARHIIGYRDPISFYTEKLCEGISTIAAAFFPKPVIVRLSDFKSNEYRNLIGGDLYEPKEENPMLGFRGASRYLSTNFRDCFELECRALRKARYEMRLTNIQIMVPFVRTLNEAEDVIALLSSFGLSRGENNLKIVMMCELPSNALLAEKFLKHFDGFSIGSNDLTQLTLGLDRDSNLVSNRFDERDPAVKVLLSNVIRTCNEAEKYIGICGQAPSDHLDFANWLVGEGIETISLNPDSVIETWLELAKDTALSN